MKDVRVDQDGELRCWNCGAKGFTEKRTLRSKALVGVGALMTKKKLKCQVCGEYNDTGSAKPYDGPASRKYRKTHKAEMDAGASAPPTSAAPSQPEAPAQAAPSKVEQIAGLVALKEQGALDDDEFARLKAEILAS